MKCDWNGAVFPFKGTKQLEENENQEETKASDYDDEEWTVSTSKCSIKLNNALGALMGAYMSDDSLGEEEIDEKRTNMPQRATARSFQSMEQPQSQTREQGDTTQTETCVVCNISDEDSPPTEVKILKEQRPIGFENISRDIVENKCHIESSSKTKKRKRTRFRPNKKHWISSRSKKNFKKKTEESNKFNFPYKFKRRKITLLEKLLKNEIAHERNVLLQCVRYVVSNNFFDKIDVAEQTT